MPGVTSLAQERRMLGGTLPVAPATRAIGWPRVARVGG